MVGKVTILRLREKARTALGPKFDIRQFHDAVLLAGSMPLTVLENAVDNYIAGRRTAWIRVHATLAARALALPGRSSC